MVRNRWLRSAGFTLIELLVVIAIIGVLVSLLLPAVQKVREAANRMSCQNNLKQLGLALQNYHSTNKCFPPGQTTIASGKSFGWIAQILPYIEQDNLYRLYKFDDNWNVNNGVPPSGTNGAKIPLLRCPSAPSKRSESNATGTDYSATNLAYTNGDLIDSTRWNSQNIPLAFNNSGVLYKTTGTDLTGNALTDILDGSSNTLLLAECAARPQTWFAGELVGSNGNGYWANPANMIIVRGSTPAGTTPTKGGSQASCAVNCYNREEVYSFHVGSANAVSADGAVRSLKSSINLFVLHALITKAGGEVNANADF